MNLKKRVLITGATGNIGFEVLKILKNQPNSFDIYAGVRNAENSEAQFKWYPELKLFEFDFMEIYSKSLEIEFETVFLLRPPQISNVKKHIEPFLKVLKNSGTKNIIFLSVQGVEKSSVIPHNKIEKLVIELGFDYIFLRPSYFMQNLTTTLFGDIKKRKIVLPSGMAKFNWVDILNIAEFTVEVIKNFDDYGNRAYDITGPENLNFQEATNIINDICSIKLEYLPANPFVYFIKNRNEKISNSMNLVMLLLHYLPRFQKEPPISDNYLKLMNKNPTKFSEFVQREISNFQ